MLYVSVLARHSCLMRSTRNSIVAVGVVTTLAMPALSACDSSGPSSVAAAQTPPATESPWPAPSPTTTLRPAIVLARFERYSPTAEAVTYDPELVPVGSEVAVVSVSADGQTHTVLVVRGLKAGRAYGAHAHNDACGENPDSSGPHFQHDVDPQQPSVNPDYANPRNEIWLDFTTDAGGTGRGESVVAWTFDDRRPKSVVIHSHRTSTEPGRAGQAGGRHACVNVGF
jgi:Cu-Zn family superoxide dismutase